MTSSNEIMRWRRVAGWNVATGMKVTVPESSGNISIPNGSINMSWSDLLIVFDGFDPELFQITAHDEDMKVLTIDVYSIPAPTSVNTASVAAQERKVLQQLLAMRTGLADLVGGHIKVETPDGTSVERMPLAVLDRRVAEVRARIAWFEAAAAGDVMPGVSFW